MPSTEKLDTHQKALTLNLDPSTFGSFAEIGAGQEVARWFLVVGGASGTVAKSISAYDKEVSDDLYGSGSRYVSRQRLEAMLDNEWAQLLTQLEKTRGSQTRFFSFVDTVSARNYAGTNDPHGWIGLRFQLQPGGPTNDILLHINLRDSSNVLQQEAIGILGVNLIHAAFYQLGTKESFFAGLAQDVPRERIEIDFVDFRGPAFASWDRSTLLAYLVHAGLAEAVFFSSTGAAVPPTEALYKKAVVLAPGYFGHVDPAHGRIHTQMLAAALEELRKELGETGSQAMGVFCLSAAPLWPEDSAPEVPDLMRRIGALLAQHGEVLLFRQRELYSMTALVNRHTKAPVRFVVGLSLLIRALDDSYFNLEGRRLEALSLLFAQNVRIYAYPMTTVDLRESIGSFSATALEWSETNGWVSAKQLRIAPPLGHLYAYLLASDFLVPMQIPAALAAEA
ncbi:MAG: hypothetical protein DMG41_32490 [Acidobacteria bacterium]|nr:MAG: hypothetical protein AUH13_02065 [Acidobacteria bacterium 13_2_20CM_58_27]PYT82804.1 MAG: hypothetical protein DMG41_32490 [Acidobacteriota bacterium]